MGRVCWGVQLLSRVALFDLTLTTTLELARQVGSRKESYISVTFEFQMIKEGILYVAASGLLQNNCGNHLTIEKWNYGNDKILD